MIGQAIQRIFGQTKSDAPQIVLNVEIIRSNQMANTGYRLSAEYAKEKYFLV